MRYVKRKPMRVVALLASAALVSSALQRARVVPRVPPARAVVTTPPPRQPDQQQETPLPPPVPPTTPLPSAPALAEDPYEVLRNGYDLNPATPSFGVHTQGSAAHWTYQPIFTAILACVCVWGGRGDPHHVQIA